jgi:hypothetical protein
VLCWVEYCRQVSRVYVCVRAFPLLGAMGAYGPYMGRSRMKRRWLSCVTKESMEQAVWRSWCRPLAISRNAGDKKRR